jgi:dTDP-4-dehydrorhamnose reductase
VERVFRRLKPQIVFNTAAFTRVDDCEKFHEAAFLANAQAPGELARFCKKYNARLVHFSTDYIFDGNGEIPYRETDEGNPLNYYGVTKWEAEKRIISSGCPFTIIRTSWIFGRNGDNFVKKILRRALAGARLQAPDDQLGAPTYSEDLARAIVKLLAANMNNIVHFTNSGHCSRYEQAKTILQLYGLNNYVEAVKNEGLRLLARRPRFSVLDISLYVKTTGHMPRSWQESTADYIVYLKQNEHELRS